MVDYFLRIVFRDRAIVVTDDRAVPLVDIYYVCVDLFRLDMDARVTLFVNDVVVMILTDLIVRLLGHHLLPRFNRL